MVGQLNKQGHEKYEVAIFYVNYWNAYSSSDIYHL